MTDVLLVEHPSNDIVVLRLNRPQVRNALNLDVRVRLADAIAREDQSTPRRIPNGDGEHAAHALEAGDAFGGIQVANHFGIARRRGVATGFLQFVAQLDVVVDLAVLRHGDRPAVYRNRLVATGDVDDAQARGTERCGAVGVQAVIIRTAMAQRPHHGGQASLFGRLTG